MPDNKRQHYVPKYTLKRFSSDIDQRQINLINIKRSIVIRGASLRDQCYRDYFYGNELTLERSLSKLEGLFGSITKEMLSSDIIDRRQAFHITIMVSLQLARTLRAEEEINWRIQKLIKTLMYNRIDEDALRKVKIGIKNGVNLNIGQALLLSPILLDMRQFLIVNRTSVPFIIADNPVVSTNWFCRTRIRDRWSAGMAVSGLQMLLPLSPTHALLLHDGNVYTTESSNSVILITRDTEVAKLNELQWLNAYQNIYFPPNLSDEHVKEILSLERAMERSSSFRRLEGTVEPNRFRSTDKDEFGVPSEGVTSELLHFGTIPTQKDIRIKGVRLRSNARFHDNGSMGAPIRDPVWSQIIEDFGSDIRSKHFTFNEIWDFVRRHPLEPHIGPWIGRDARNAARNNESNLQTGPM